MTAPLLSVGDATVWPSIWGGHLVDNGSAFPQHFPDRRAAYAEAAARSKDSGSTPPPSPGTVPESTNSTSPGGCGSGTSGPSDGRCGTRPSDLAADTAGVGAGVRADVGSVRTPAGDREVAS